MWEYWLEYFTLEDDELPSAVTFGGRDPEDLAKGFRSFAMRFYFYGIVEALSAPLLVFFLIREVMDLRADKFDFLFFL